ncbi:lipocalin family protein [uncultured Psychroserpens sp.]|uniref:lipocalin family protein n=1 Tax=uncultured Psychroserpens sp. TaxID=255436 RepID=UPI002618E650|nr:lipocalin family protein [uncultured Psychroserpens sp.]
MKKQLLVLLVITLMLSCNNDDQNNSNIELIGNWKLIEVLANPGGGSGTFMPVESDKTIEFENSGTITTNTSLCDPYSDEIITTGSFSLTNNTITTNCQNPNITTISFELNDQHLILNFISNEGYSQKFKKNN